MRSFCAWFKGAKRRTLSDSNGLTRVMAGAHVDCMELTELTGFL
jgi:hypothetical protein